MSKLNLIFNLNAYEDATYTNAPNLNNCRWNRELTGVDIQEPETKTLILAAGETRELFSGSVTTSADITTTYDLALKSGTSSTYTISHNGGTAPAFRTARVSGADATTVVSVSKNAKLMTVSATSGSLFTLIAGGVIVGDEVRLGSVFNSLNQGKFKIISLTATSFTVENEVAVAEAGLVLGASFATQVNIFSATGVQINDKIEITAGFSLVSQGTYSITDVSHNYIEFYTVAALPTETAISNNPSAFTIYRQAKQLVYMEADKKIKIKLNDSAVAYTIEPFTAGIQSKPGMFFLKSTIKKIEVINPTVEAIRIFYVTAE